MSNFEIAFYQEYLLLSTRYSLSFSLFYDESRVFFDTIYNIEE